MWGRSYPAATKAAWPSGLGKGLQSPVQRFDSARRLQQCRVDPTQRKGLPPSASRCDYASMPRPTSRIGTERDLEAARAVLAAAYGEYEPAFSPETWKRYLADILDLEGRAAESELIVAELDGRLVGCVSYFPPGAKASYPSDAFSEHWPPDWAAFRLLAVDPSARGSGVGRHLTDVCIERARSAKAPVLGLHTTEPMMVARAMYERMGFERAPQYDFRPGPEVLVEAYRLVL